MRNRADEQRVFTDRRFERDGFEQLGATAREDRDGLTLGGVVFLEIVLNPGDVLVETGALGRLFGHPFRALVKNLSDELLMLLATDLVAREAEVEADYWKRAGFQRGQYLHPLTQRLN